MIRGASDVAVLGGGFAGCLLALVLQRIGRSVVVLERDSHPRFAIGESSTPLANLALEELARHYDLPRLLPLTEYGSWQRTYPELACGLKRGFSYFRHEEGRPFHPTRDHATELLVAASPSDEVSDTHWFRADFDHFLAREVQSAGVGFLDRTEVQHLSRGEGWTLLGHRGEEQVEIEASFLVDASGPGGLLTRLLGLKRCEGELGTQARALFSHFQGVARWEGILADRGGVTHEHPFPCDDAALHHVFDDGWMWVLRFNNGLTSAGFSLTSAPPAVSPEEEWQQRLERFPSIGRHFAGAQTVRPLTRTGRLQRWTRQVAGPGWALLAHAAYFLDALFSPGIAHTLLSIERLAHTLEHHWGRASMAEELDRYSESLEREVGFLDHLIHGCYESFRNFDLFASFSMYYFAGAIWSEHRRRAGQGGPTDGFLFSHHEPFRAAVQRRHSELLELLRQEASPAQAEAFRQGVAEDIAPLNLAGLCDPAKRNLYPFV